MVNPKSTVIQRQQHQQQQQQQQGSLACSNPQEPLTSGTRHPRAHRRRLDRMNNKNKDNRNMLSILLASLTLLIMVGNHHVTVVMASFDDETGLTDHARLRQSLEYTSSFSLREYHELISSNSKNISEAARLVTERMTQSIQERLGALFQQASTAECRSLIAQHLNYFVHGIGREEPVPAFAEMSFTNECPEPAYDWDNLPEGIHIGKIQNRTYQPPRDEEGVVYKDADQLRLLYGIMTHDDAAATIRLLTVLDEQEEVDDNDGEADELGTIRSHRSRHVFVVHVDGKYEDTYSKLVEYASTRENVHILDHRRRVRVNWGGFSMVNATLQILQYAFGIDNNDYDNTSTDEEEEDTVQEKQQQQPLEFDKFVHLASSSYPLASNREIRERIAEFPLDANLMYLIMKPSRPKPWGWHYFVECDDRLHRIHRLMPLQNATHGIDMYTSSQWFILSREFAQYLAEAKRGSFVSQFLEYIQHVVVADETFFGTVLRNTEFCTKHHNRNFLHLQFDRWESELPQGKRDERKCMMKDPDHCGRSPTIMTVDYVDILELSNDLFARKFDDSVDSKVKDIVDQWRSRRDEDSNYDRSHNRVPFEGHGALIVAKETVDDDDPLCLGLGETGNALRLVPCFYEDILPLLSRDWATGAVISEETMPHNRWEVGPCTTDGLVERLSTGEMNATPGEYSITGPRCMIKQMDGIRAGRCLDVDSGSLQPGGASQVYPCMHKWFQFVSFGDGRVAPFGSIVSIIPSHIVRQIRNLGHDRIEYMCLGVYGRGIKDEVEWDEEGDNEDPDQSLYEDEPNEWERLSEFANHHVITTQCTNTGAVIEWLFVPFIFEEDSPITAEVDIIYNQRLSIEAHDSVEYSESESADDGDDDASTDDDNEGAEPRKKAEPSTESDIDKRVSESSLNDITVEAQVESDSEIEYGEDEVVTTAEITDEERDEL